jgi:hypothetical protein
VNGDGYDDVVVGAPNYSNRLTQEGMVAAYYGSPTGPSPTWNWKVESNDSQAWLGTSVDGAGDMNGDGYADVVVGAQGANGPGVDFAGGMAVFYGSAGGLRPTARIIAVSNQSFSDFGASVAGAGDRPDVHGVTAGFPAQPLIDSR